jgi:hypothetical protein
VKLTALQKAANRLAAITNQLTAVGPQKRVAIVAVVFQKLIRLRAADNNGMCVCFTCDKPIKWNLKGTHAGHFLTRAKLGTVFNPMNCHPQCAACNQHKGGSSAIYERRMRAKYGDDEVDALISNMDDFEPEVIKEEKIIPEKKKEVIQKIDDAKIAKAILEGISEEIKPYSSNQANQHPVSFKDFEVFVKKWIESPVDKKFTFVNELLIQDTISKERNSFSDDHVYITPSGNFGVLEFDLNDNEFFLEYSTFEQYLTWCEKEKLRVSKNKFCKNCEYYGHCLSEHLREVKDINNSCNGFKLLIDWYKEKNHA